MHIKIIATACCDPSEGFDRWRPDLIKGKLEQERTVASISEETLRLVLREHNLKPWRQKRWCVPKLDDEYIARMAEVLDVYERPYNPAVPVVCIDEQPLGRHGDFRPAIPRLMAGPSELTTSIHAKARPMYFEGLSLKEGHTLTQ